MFVSARASHDPYMQRTAMNSVAVDMDTMEKIDHVIWANEEKGRYRKYITDPNGKIARTDSRIASEIKTIVCSGNIKIMTIDEFEALAL